MPTVRAAVRPTRSREETPSSRRKAVWIRIGVGVLLVAAAAAIWHWTPIRELLNLQRLSAWMEPYRHAWYALPVVAGAYVVLGVFMISVLLLILATGVAFGPWLGTLYALVGCLVSASAGFWLGRWAGPRRVEKVAGERVKRFHQKLSETEPS